MIVNFTLNKIAVDKKKRHNGPIKVNSLVNVKDIKETEFPVKDKKAIKVNFEYIVKYDPNAADIVMKGFLIYLVDNAKKVVDKWKADGVIEDMEMNSLIVNTVLTRCSVKALQLAESMNLPLPIKLPKITAETEKKDSSYIG